MFTSLPKTAIIPLCSPHMVQVTSVPLSDGASVTALRLPFQAYVEPTPVAAPP